MDARAGFSSHRGAAILVSLAVQDGLPPLKAGQMPLPPVLGYGVRRVGAKFRS